jgi:hypothetical protein
MLRLARQWPQRVWAVEGANSVGRPVAQRLLVDGERVLDVPAKLAARARVFDIGQGRKTDAHDAHAVVMVALRDRGLRGLTVDAQFETLGSIVSQSFSGDTGHGACVFAPGADGGRGMGSDVATVTVNGVDVVTGDYLLPPMTVSDVAQFAVGDAPARGEIAELRARQHRATERFLGVREGVNPTDLADLRGCLRRICTGQPVGYAMEYLNQRYAELASEVATLLEEAREGRRVDDALLTGMWTASNDARGYAVLGDPAVYLPVTSSESDVDVSAGAFAAPSYQGTAGSEEGGRHGP